MGGIISEFSRSSIHAWLLSAFLLVPLVAAQDDPEYRPHVVVVQFAPEAAIINKASTTGLEEFDRRAARYGVHIIERVYPFLDHVEPTPKTRRNLMALRRTYYVRYNAGAAPRVVAKDLGVAPGVVYAEPALVNRTSFNWVRADPNDPAFGDQPEMRLLRLPEAWDLVKSENGVPKVVIAVVDGGGDWWHEDLLANVWTNPDEVADNGIDDDGNGFIDDVHGVNFANNDDMDNDPIGLPETPENALHGTASAGSASAVTNNGIGVAGAAWNASLMHINAGCDYDYGICFGYEGILYAAANGADIINASWGGYAGSDDDIRLPDETLNLATDLGALVVAAAGNDNLSNDLNLSYPARNPRVLSVGATEKDSRQLAGFSNYGRMVNVFAPGVRIVTTASDNRYVYISGTSFSSPLTAGVAALVKTRFPEMTPDASREQIRATADNIDSDNPGLGGRLGKGLVDAEAAVQSQNLPGVRLAHWSWADDDGDQQIRSGDAVTVTLMFVNHLADARQLKLGFVAADSYPFIEAKTSEVDVGFLASGDSVEVRFEYSVAANAPANQRVRLFTRVKDGTHEDHAELLTFRVNHSIEALHQDLSAFYTATGGDQWIDNSNWDITRVPTEDELTTWNGVAVSDGWLIALDLNKNNLTGQLPPEIGNFSQLAELWMFRNSLMGPIPPAIGNLRQLQVFIVENNDFTGPIPSEIGNLQELQILDLGRNSLSGPIPPAIGNLSNLQELWLRGNSLTGPIPSKIWSLKQLRSLALGQNPLGGTIPSEVGNLQQMRYLDIRSASLTGPLPTELGSLQRLGVLYLSHNVLTGSIPSELGNLEHLYNLNLSYNDLTGQIPPELTGLRQLLWLNLASNDLTGSISPQLGNLGELLTLALSHNQLTGPIPPELGNLSKLQKLHLSYNTLTGPIPPQLGNLSQLESLYLSDNTLTGPIPSQLGDLSQLKSLDLSGNTLTESIPPQLGNLSQLESLHLSVNTLTGPIPSQLGNLSQLESLDLSENTLTGSIPPEFGSLEQLLRLVISNSSLTGPIPAELGSLSQLQRLNLSGNTLIGSIPSEFGSLEQLEELDLSNNSLTGPIPHELGSLSQLQGPLLTNIELEESSPLKVESNSHIQRPQYTDESLAVNRRLDNSGFSQIGEPTSISEASEGLSPSDLENSQQLYIMNLSHNDLTGPIPPELGNLSQLQILLVNDNSLTGEIPVELGSLSELLELFLQDNALTGALPGSFLQLANLDQFHFGGQELCAPNNSRFQAWLRRIQDVTGDTCPAVEFAGTIPDQSLPRAQAMTPLVLPEATGGVAPFDYTLTPSLPNWLTFDPATRTISGTPTEVTASPLPFSYKATDAYGSEDSLQFNIEVFSPVATEQEVLPEAFTLLGNYPNPFRESTRIVFDLPWPAHITVEITDLTGRRVLELPPEDLSAGWKREVELNGGALSSGLYHYRLRIASPEGSVMHSGHIVRIR